MKRIGKLTSGFMIDNTKVAHMGYHRIDDDNRMGEDKQKENGYQRHDRFLDSPEIQ